MVSASLAFYLRLSEEDFALGMDADKIKGESNSITNQRILLQNFIEGQKDFIHCRVTEYCDDGYTGTNTNRPSFQKMIMDARAGKIDTILIKDYSRFGRNFLEVGRYLEEILPELGIRVISVNDGYDSNQVINTKEGLLVPIKNLVNDYYVKDLSHKVKSGIYSRQKKGDFISPLPIFGYEKSREDIHRLVPRQETASIVREIYDLALDGKNSVEIAGILNHKNVHTPGWFVNQRSGRQYPVDAASLWTSAKVMRILRDRRYAGDMVSNIRKRKGIAGKETVRLKEEDWITVLNTHQGIVTREEYRLVNEKRMPKKKRDSVARGERRKQYFFYCPYCHRKLQRSHTTVNPFYSCMTGLYSGDSGCNRICVYEQRLVVDLTMLLQYYMKIVVDRKRMIHRIVQKESENRTDIMSLEDLEGAVAKLQHKILTMYERFRMGNATKEEYLCMREKSKNEIAALEDRKLQMGCAIGSGESQNRLRREMEERIRCYQNGKEMSLGELNVFLSSVKVYPDRILVVTFSFQDIYRLV